MPVARTPPPAGEENVTTGAVLYCWAVVAGNVTGIESNVKLEAVNPREAVAAAPEPPPPVMVTVGTAA